MITTSCCKRRYVIILKICQNCYPKILNCAVLYCTVLYCTVLLGSDYKQMFVTSNRSQDSYPPPLLLCRPNACPDTSATIKIFVKYLGNTPPPAQTTGNTRHNFRWSSPLVPAEQVVLRRNDLGSQADRIIHFD